MKQNKQQHRRRSVAAALKGGVLSAGLLALSGGPAGAAPAVTLTATATQGGTCTVDVSPPALSMGNIKASDVVGVGGVGLVSPMKKTTISLKNCNGLGDMTKVPVVRIRGQHPIPPEIKDGSSGIPFLFKDGGNSYRYWFVVTQDQNLKTYDQPRLFGETTGDQGMVAFGKAGENGGGLQKDIWLGVTCANASYCTTALPGTLTATINFYFLYQ